SFARSDVIDGRRRLGLAIFERLLTPKPPRAIDPEVRRHPKDPCARILGRRSHLAQGHEGARERVLREIFGVPGAAREVPAVAIELGSKRLVGVEESMPRST